MNPAYTQQPSIHLPPDVEHLDPASYFIHFLPLSYIEADVLLAINLRGGNTNPKSWRDLTIWEYLLWIGLWTYMMFLKLPDRDMYWENYDFGLLGL